MNTLFPNVHRLGFRVTGFALVVAALVASAPGAIAQTSQPLDLDGDGRPEFLNVTTTSGSPVSPGIAAHLETVNPNDIGIAITATPLSQGSLVRVQSSWGHSS